MATWLAAWRLVNICLCVLAAGINVASANRFFTSYLKLGGRIRLAAGFRGVFLIGLLMALGFDGLANLVHSTPLTWRTPVLSPFLLGYIVTMIYVSLDSQLVLRAWDRERKEGL